MILNQRVKLLLQVLPYVAKETCFALKGGTAINLFVRNFPRLSVDIDLTYLGDESRDEALKIIEQALYRIQADIEDHLKPIKVFSSSRKNQENDIKLFIEKNGIQVKVEASPVIRGVLLETNTRSLVSKAVDEFEMEMDIQVVSLPDLYGGKIAAALNRQHPRDLFDVKLLLENEGITTPIKNGFLTYLLSHGRPPNEILNPTKQSMETVLESEFEGMSSLSFTYKDFEDIREQLILKINKKITKTDKDFLISFFQRSPKWELFQHDNIKDLPAIKWKLLNIEKMSLQKKEEQLKNLKKILS